MNIVIYKGQFQYDVVNYFVDELGQGLMEIGNKVNILDLSKMSPAEVAFYFLHNQIDLVLSFNGINFTEQNVFEKLNIPLGIILVDHPFYHLSRIEAYKGDTTFFCMYDIGYLDCFEECIDKNIPISWLPHGGTEKSLHKIANKEHQIILPGSIEDYTKLELELFELDNGSIKRVAYNLYERGIQNYNVPLYLHFKEELKELGIKAEDLRNQKNYLTVFSYIYILVDKILRARKRYEIIKALLDEGITVQHYGRLQKDELVNNKNFITNGPIDYIDLLLEIKRSKILLHDTPYFKNGSHERVLTSMLNGTLVLSNINNYCNNQYIDGENIIFYNINNLNTLIEKTHFYLENEEERIFIEKNAYETTKRFNTWKNRAQEILSIYHGFMEMKNR
jgi:glycosyltransferase involved in cell wall biosynthesis